MNYIEKVKKNGVFKRWDLIILIILIVVVALTVVFALAPAGEYAEISEDGRLLKILPLAVDSITEAGGLKVVVKDKKIFVTEADCPDKLCQKHLPIGNKGDTIVCLPNKIVIKIVGKAALDGII